jgi:hypothetical protein
MPWPTVTCCPPLLSAAAAAAAAACSACTGRGCSNVGAFVHVAVWVMTGVLAAALVALYVAQTCAMRSRSERVRNITRDQTSCRSYASLCTHACDCSAGMQWVCQPLYDESCLTCCTEIHLLLTSTCHVDGLPCRAQPRPRCLALHSLTWEFRPSNSALTGFPHPQTAMSTCNKASITSSMSSIRTGLQLLSLQHCL